MKAKRWIGLCVVTLALAGILHLLIVCLIPHVITGAFIRGVGKQAGYNTVLRPPLPTDKARSVVAPSPDLLYAICVFDVSAGPVHISARPPKSYWSLSLFDRNSDNFFRINDSELKGEVIDLILADAPVDPALKAKFPAAVFVQSPRATGVMLTRMLVLDPADMQAQHDAQSSVSCSSLAGQG